MGVEHDRRSSITSGSRRTSVSPAIHQISATGFDNCRRSGGGPSHPTSTPNGDFRPDQGVCAFEIATRRPLKPILSYFSSTGFHDSHRIISVEMPTLRAPLHVGAGLRAVLAATVLTLLAQFAHAGATLSIGPPPNYLSGTFCRLTGTAVAVGGTTRGFLAATLFVNGYPVKHWENQEPALQHITIAAVIDSTHFAHASNVSIWMTALGDDQVTYTSPTTTIGVWNLAAVFGRYDLEFDWLNWQVTGPPGQEEGAWVTGDGSWGGCVPAAEHLLDMNHFLYGQGIRAEQGWDWADISAAFGPSTVAYVNTHGGVDDGIFCQPFFRTDSDDYWYYWPDPFEENEQHPQERIFGVLSGSIPPHYYEVMPIRQLAIGGGLPPINDGTPPMNLAYIDGCECAVQLPNGNPPINCTFPEAFLYPVTNAYNPPVAPEDQAFCSFLIKVNAYRTSATVSEFFGRLEEGYTVNQARVFAFFVYSNGALPRDWESLAHLWMAVYGDWATRTHGVYTGVQDVSPVSAWYRG